MSIWIQSRRKWFSAPSFLKTWMLCRLKIYLCRGRKSCKLMSCQLSIPSWVSQVLNARDKTTWSLTMPARMIPTSTKQRLSTGSSIGQTTWRLTAINLVIEFLWLSILCSLTWPGRESHRQKMSSRSLIAPQTLKIKISPTLFYCQGLVVLSPLNLKLKHMLALTVNKKWWVASWRRSTCTKNLISV